MSKKKNLPAVLSALAAALAGCGAAGPVPSAPDAQTPPPELAPFSVSARVHGATVLAVTDALARHLEEVDDTGRGWEGDWRVAGATSLAEGEPALAAALKLPTGDRILEVCNHHYAQQAMAFGGAHGVALPCEVGVVQDGADVQVVLLNPEAIFALFFSDVPAEHAEGMAGLAARVRTELDGLVAAALEGLPVQTPRTAVGPSYAPDEVAALAAKPKSIAMDLPVPEASRGSADARKAFQARFVDRLLTTLTHERMTEVGSKVAGLSVGDWRAARPHALRLPGEVDVVELCSPTYARAAMSTGGHHAPALPCQASVWLDGDTLRVHLLDPNYIFPVFFSDAPADQMEAMRGMASAVRSDIQALVAAAQDGL